MFPIASLGRMLVSAAIRRALWRSPKAWLIAGFLVGLVLMSIGTARAQSMDRGQAYAKCMTDLASYVAARGGPHRNLVCENRGSAYEGTFQFQNNWADWISGAYGWFPFTQCPANAPWDEAAKKCQQSCSSKPDVTVTRPPFAPVGMGNPSSFGQCSGGCYVSYQNMQDGTYVGMHFDTATCTADGLPNTETCTVFGKISGPWGCQDPAQECAANQVKDPVTGECKGSTCPAGMVMTVTGECANEGKTCPPGQIKSPEGGCTSENNCSAGAVLGPDGTCKRDADGDGEPDDAEGESFSGGDGCNNPPACSGSPILCGQARIQWRIECNTRRKANISGGSCGAMPICSGENCDLMEYAQLIQQWRTACTLEKLAQGSGAIGGGDGDGDDDGPPQSWDSVGDAAAVVDEIGGTGDPADAFTDGSEGGDGTGELDTSGFGYGTTCPQLPTIQVFDTTVDFNTAAPDMCRWFQLAGQIVLVLAALTSLRIIAAGGA